MPFSSQGHPRSLQHWCRMAVKKRSLEIEKVPSRQRGTRETRPSYIVALGGSAGALEPFESENAETVGA